MENLPTAKNEYEDAKYKAKQLYLKIGRVWCPALGDFVVFNSDGFRHLIWRNALPRPKSEQMRRFLLLPFAAPMIYRGSSYQTYRNGKRSGIKFWAISGFADHQPVRIVIRQVGNGYKHFFSIFEERKNKNQPVRADL